MNSDKLRRNTEARISDSRARRLYPRIGYVCYLLGFLILTSLRLHADQWTNTAGHGIEAKLVSLENGSVTLQRTHGKPFSMKLSSFCATDQKRIRKHFGLAETPKPISAKELAYEKQWDRLRQLYDAGKMDEKEYLRRQQAIREHFRGETGQ